MKKAARNLFLVLLGALMTFGAFADAGDSATTFSATDFWRNPTGNDISWKDIAAHMKLNEGVVRFYGPENRKNTAGLRSGEWTATHDLDLEGGWFGWYYHLGQSHKKVRPTTKWSEVKTLLERQARQLPSEEAALVRKALKEGPAPVTGKLNRYDCVPWMSFWYQGKTRFARNAICLWQDMANAGKSIESVSVSYWPKYGVGYVHGCHNLYAMINRTPPEPPKKLEPTPKPTPMPTEPPKHPSPPAPFAVEPETELHPMWGEGVVWMNIGGLFHDHNSEAHINDEYNSFDGVEWRYAFHKDWRLVVKGEPALQSHNDYHNGNRWSEVGATVRAGVRYQLLSTATYGVDAEAGIAGNFRSDGYAVAEWDYGQSELIFHEGDVGQSAFGGYARILGWAQHETFWEAEYQVLSGYRSNLKFNVSTEPHQLYFELGGNIQDEEQLNDSGLVYRHEADYREYNFRAGYIFGEEKPLITALMIRQWDYSSDVWEADLIGFGAYVQWRYDLKKRWRFEAEALYCNRTDGPTGESGTDSNEFDVRFGWTYTW